MAKELHVMDTHAIVATITKVLQAQLLVARTLNVNFRTMIPALSGHIALVYGPVTMPTAGRQTISISVVRDEEDSVPAAGMRRATPEYDGSLASWRTRAFNRYIRRTTESTEKETSMAQLTGSADAFRVVHPLQYYSKFLEGRDEQTGFCIRETMASQTLEILCLRSRMKILNQSNQTCTK